MWTLLCQDGTITEISTFEEIDLHIANHEVKHKIYGEKVPKNPLFKQIT